MMVAKRKYKLEHNKNQGIKESTKYVSSHANKTPIPSYNILGRGKKRY
jgi:hypothetical protein